MLERNKIKSFFIVLFCVTFFCNIYAKSDSTYDELRKMIDILEIIDTKYVEKKENKDLVVDAIRGMVRSLDSHSFYLTEKEYKDEKNELKGAFGGVGLRFNVKNNELTVIAPMVNTPAFKAGILPGDKIIKIDGKNTKDMPTEKAIELMRGNPGTKVILTIYRPATREELDFNLKRKKIKIETVSKKIIDGNVGYIKLFEFGFQCPVDITDILQNKFKGKIKSLIFDLRNNPGGLLDSAINICSLFIKEGSLVVSTECRDKTMEQQFYTQDKPIFAELPIIILINGNSASASEITAGTLQDYKRALVIGSNSYGKGTVQTLVPLSDGSAVRLTIAKYCLPSGRKLNRVGEKQKDKNGLTPDICIEVSPEIEGKLYMQEEMKKLPEKQQSKEVIVDEVLETAIKIIKADKVQTYIDKPQQYLKDYPQEKKEHEKDEEKNKQEEKTIEKNDVKNNKIDTKVKNKQKQSKMKLNTKGKNK